MKKNVVKKCLIAVFSALLLVFVIAACGNNANDSITTITDLTGSAAATSAVGSGSGAQTTAVSPNVTENGNTSESGTQASGPITTEEPSVTTTTAKPRVTTTTAKPRVTTTTAKPRVTTTTAKPRVTTTTAKPRVTTTTAKPRVTTTTAKPPVTTTAEKPPVTTTVTMPVTTKPSGWGPLKPLT